jgi:hypothetical protein
VEVWPPLAHPSRRDGAVPPRISRGQTREPHAERGAEPICRNAGRARCGRAGDQGSRSHQWISASTQLLQRCREMAETAVAIAGTPFQVTRYGPALGPDWIVIHTIR